MNKIIIMLLSIIVVIAAMVTALIIYMPEKEESVKIANIAQNKVDNDKNEMENVINVVETNTNEERISPNAFITFKQTYNECGHTKVEFVEVPQEFVNLTEEELKQKYPEWNVEKFTDTDIILNKDVKGNCNEHYIVKDVNGIVTVFRVLADGTEEEYQVTDIATEYLTDNDKIEMEKGIKVNGKQNLNQLIEDYE